MSGLSSSSTTDILVALLFGATCLGPLIALRVLRLWLDFRPLRLQRIARMEYKINLIAEHLGVDVSSSTDEVLQHLWNGNKINAIKLYRERTGVDLKEGKDTIDAMDAALDRGETVTLERGNGPA